MRAFVLLIAACATKAGPIDESGVIEVSWPDPAPMRLDVLVVVDNSPAILPYREQLARELSSIGDLAFGAPLQLHVGVVTGDLGGNQDTPEAPMPGQCAGWGDAGALRRSPLVIGDPFLALTTGPGSAVANTAAPLPDAMVSLGNVDGGGCSRNQPLEAMRIALDHDPHNAGFLRDSAHLAVVIVAAQEDGSPLVPADYAEFLSRLKPRGDVIPIVFGRDSLRLDEFSRMFIRGGYYESIDAVGMSGAFEFAYESFVPLNSVIASRCLGSAVLDTDPQTPGIQPDCSVHDNQQVIPRCGDTVQFPCWSAAVDPVCDGDHLRLDVHRGDFDPPDNNVIVAECVSR